MQNEPRGEPSGEWPPARSLVGHPGEPIRAFAFTGGGFNTVMQLGVAHALLVSQRKPPDVVVGVSVGAVNAVALADIMRAGDDAVRARGDAMTADVRWRTRMAARVARFRRIFEAYQDAPTEIMHAILPDSYQVDAEAPLEPVKLPIHFRSEREYRGNAVKARAGFINLYNQLLNLRVSIGTVTRIVRSILGFRAAGNLAQPRRIIGQTFEVFRLWTVIGVNLPRLAHLIGPVAYGVLRPTALPDEGATAAHLIFRSRLWSGLRNAFLYVLVLLGSTVLWVSISLLVPGLALLLIDMWREGWRAAVKNPAWLMFGAYTALGILGASLILSVGAVFAKDRRGLRDVLTAISNLVVVLTGAVAALLSLCVAIVLLTRVLSPDKSPPLTGIGDLVAMVRAAWPESAYILVSVFLLFVVVIGAIAALLILVRPRSFMLRLLKRYDMADALFSPHVTRQQFVSLFDPEYYGPLSINNVIDSALSHDKPLDQADARHAKKKINAFAPPNDGHPIHVGVAAADVTNGKLTVLSDDVPIVDALLAAVAATPLFPPKLLNLDGVDRVLIDGTNVANEPTRALMDFLRSRVHPKATALHVYPVASLPFSRPELNDKAGTFYTLVDVAKRSLQLQRFRDATLERRFTELYTSVMPAGDEVVVTVPRPVGERSPDGKTTDNFLRATIDPIEPGSPLNAGERLGASTRAQRRDVIAETVADGCRAALQTLVLREPSACDLTPLDATPNGRQLSVISCKRAIAQHLADEAASLPPDIVRRDDWQILAGTSPQNVGPGLDEVCSHCAIRAIDREAMSKETRQRLTAALEWVEKVPRAPAWPHELSRSLREAGRQTAPARRVSARDPRIETRERSTGGSGAPDTTTSKNSELPSWPRGRTTADGLHMPGETRPTVSLLFSGGVFRGVFQVGVLNALEEAGVRPDLVAGASVGSITAAMVAEVLSYGDGRDQELERKVRHRQIASLAATYLAVDRLILTDRFADFIREFTLRAAATRFSIEDADGLFRRYDSAHSAEFGYGARRVIAGLERLLYVSPFELTELVRAFRNRDVGPVLELLRRYAKEWTERMGVGDQILGAEPLELLIRQHVLMRLRSASSTGQLVDLPLRSFLDRGILFLATTTNLKQGSLQVLGDHQIGQLGSDGENGDEMLLESLLASSAFPGVFRPRWSWEVVPDTKSVSQYIDGGVMDNLPLDAVSRFLDHAARPEANYLITRRPSVRGKPVPHMIFAASLEVDIDDLSHGEAKALCDDWPALSKRARQLRYNKKLETYEQAQVDLREIFEYAMRTRRWPEREPLDLHVVAVRPRRLCGTYGFHPMLGFRRKNQAASIAHGCASTLAALAAEQVDHKPWLDAWGIDCDRLPSAKQVAQREPLRPDTSVKAGMCWFRPNAPCPFSATSLTQFEDGHGDTGHDAIPSLSRSVIDSLDAIYKACGRHKTHERRS